MKLISQILILLSIFLMPTYSSAMDFEGNNMEVDETEPPRKKLVVFKLTDGVQVLYDQREWGVSDPVPVKLIENDNDK